MTYHAVIIRGMELFGLLRKKSRGNQEEISVGILLNTAATVLKTKGGVREATTSLDATFANNGGYRPRRNANRRKPGVSRRSAGAKRRSVDARRRRSAGSRKSVGATIL